MVSFSEAEFLSAVESAGTFDLERGCFSFRGKLTQSAFQCERIADGLVVDRNDAVADLQAGFFGPANSFGSRLTGPKFITRPKSRNGVGSTVIFTFSVAWFSAGCFVLSLSGLRSTVTSIGWSMYFASA